MPASPSSMAVPQAVGTTASPPDRSQSNHAKAIMCTVLNVHVGAEENRIREHRLSQQVVGIGRTRSAKKHQKNVSERLFLR